MMNDWIPWPDSEAPRYLTNTACDMLVGPCACGATHTAKETAVALLIANRAKRLIFDRTAHDRWSTDWILALADFFAAAGNALREIDPFACVELREQLKSEIWRAEQHLEQAVRMTDATTAAERRVKTLEKALSRFLHSSVTIIGERHPTSDSCPTWYDCCHCEETELRAALVSKGEPK